MPSAELIDWSSLAANSLWLLGLSIALTCAGFRAYARQMKLPRANRLQAGYLLGGALFAAGLALTSRQALETALWAGMALLLAGMLVVRLVRKVQARHLPQSN
jgi:hypothetical protein